MAWRRLAWGRLARRRQRLAWRRWRLRRRSWRRPPLSCFAGVTKNAASSSVAPFDVTALQHFPTQVAPARAALVRVQSAPSFSDKPLARFARRLARFWLSSFLICATRRYTAVAKPSLSGSGHDGLCVFRAVDACFSRAADRLGLPPNASAGPRRYTARRSRRRLKARHASSSSDTTRVAARVRASQPIRTFPA